MRYTKAAMHFQVGDALTGSADGPMELDGKAFMVLKIDDYGTPGLEEERDLLAVKVLVGDETFDSIFAPGDVAWWDIPPERWESANNWAIKLLQEAGATDNDTPDVQEAQAHLVKAVLAYPALDPDPDDGSSTLARPPLRTV